MSAAGKACQQLVKYNVSKISVAWSRGSFAVASFLFEIIRQCCAAGSAKKVYIFRDSIGLVAVYYSIQQLTCSILHVSQELLARFLHACGTSTVVAFAAVACALGCKGLPEILENMRAAARGYVAVLPHPCQSIVQRLTRYL